MKTHPPALPLAPRFFSAWLAFCLVAVLALPALARERGDAEKAREAWMAGYVKYEAAAKAEEGGNQPLALDFYREALDAFKKVQARYPGWNPSLLDFRVNYCAERIRSLEVKVAAKNVSLTREGLISLTRSQEARLRLFTQDNSDLKKRLELAGKSLEQARAEAATQVAAAAELDRVLQENSALKVAQAAAERREAERQAEMEKLRSETVQKKKADQLQLAVDAARARQAELEQLGTENRETVNRLTAQARDAILRKGQLEQETGALKSRLESLAKLAEARDADLDSLRRQAEAARKDAVRAARQAEEFRKQSEESNSTAQQQADELRTTQQAREAAVRELKTAKGELENARDEGRDLKTALAKAEAKAAALKREKEALFAASAGELSTTAADREAARQDQRAANAELVKVKEALADARAAAAKVKAGGDQKREELQGELRTLTADRNALRQKLEAGRQEWERVRRDQESATAACDLMAARLVLAEQKAALAATTPGGVKPEAVMEAVEITGLRRQLVRCEAELGAAQTIRARLEVENGGLRNAQARNTEEADKLRQAEVRHQEEVQKLQTAHDALVAGQQQALEGYTTDIKVLQRQKAVTVEELDKANRRLAYYSSGLTSAAKKQLEQKDAELQAAAELQVKYEEALGILKRQKAKAEGELAAANQQREQRAAELQQAVDQADKLKKRLAAGSFKENEIAEKLADAQQDNERFAQALEKLKSRNGELNAALDAVRVAQAAADKNAAGLAEKAESLRKERDGIVGEARALKEQYEQSRQLARVQEEKLAGLEKTVSAQMKLMNDSEAKTKGLEAALKLAADKISAMEGLLPGKGDLQAATTALIARVNKAEQDGAAQEAELKSARQELRQARLALSQERVAKTGDDPMLEQLRRINRELDQERDKTRALEQTVGNLKTKLAEATPAPVPVPFLVTGAAAASPSGEQQRRDADRVVIVNGFLQKGADAEKLGKPEAAVWNYKKALEYQPECKLASKRLGILASRRGNQEEAESHLRRAFYADPDDVDVLLPLGLALVRQGKADLAVSMLARAVSLHPEDAGIHRAYGIACSQLGWRDAAEAQFRRTLAMDARDGDTAFNLAVLLATSTPPRLQDAQQWYKRSRELGIPADPGLDKLFSAGE